MNMDMAAELFKMIPFTSWISLLALMISILSLYISIRKLNYERKIESARKRTELMNRLSDSKRSLETSLRYCNFARPVLKECQDKWQAHIPKIEGLIESIDKSYAVLEKCGDDINPLRFESITPGIYKSLREFESLQIEFKELLDWCSSCPQNSITECHDPKAKNNAK